MTGETSGKSPDPGRDILWPLPTTSETAMTQGRVQQLVMEHGEYVPLELLLAMNLLDYEQYRAWREGRIETLDDILSAGTNGTEKLLRDAGRWAGELGLEPEVVEYYGRSENAESVLTTSSNPPLDELLCTRFRRTGEDVQTDLFLDTASTRAITGLVGSLAAGDAEGAGKALRNLVRVDPGHRQRENGETLIAALELPAPIGTDEGYSRLERMEREWLPAASDLLGRRARDFLAPLWRGIGGALDDGEFDPGHPGRHASRAYLEGLDWENVKRSVFTVTKYKREPELLVRLAEACWRLCERAGTIEAWFMLCHAAPVRFAELVESPGFPDWSLREAWRISLEWNPEPEAASYWLPAWMLLEDPGLAGVLEPRPGDNLLARAFEAVRALLGHPQPDGRGMELRGALKAIHPGMLEHFLKSLISE